MGSPCSQEWLELSLGLRATKKKQEQEDERKKQLCKQKKVTCSTISHQQYFEGEDGLDLRLQIGPNQTYNMGIMDIMFHQNHNNINQNYCPFHTHYYNSITNFPLSSSPSPNSSGLWFSLLSSPNRKGGAALPQIPKPYIRVKDEKMTVLMVKKYLLTKLGLSNEAELELWCMGERLLQSQSLKQVRDGVWLPKLVEFVNSNSSLSTSSIFHQNQTPSSTTYLMSLHYGRTCFF